MAVAGSGKEGNMTRDFAQFDLMREIADSERQKPWPAGIHARILTKKPDFRVVLISMETAARLKEHHVDGTSSVQVLKGQIRYSTGGQAYDLQTGGLIVLGASIAHEVESLDESAFLLTISGPGNQRRPASAP
jgi:quercetin dioxygenase-like cupin family protein